MRRHPWRTSLRAILLVIALAFAAAAPLFAQPPSTAAQEGFVPVKNLPAQEQLPAAPLVMAAYAIAWVVLVGYLWSIWQRLSRVEREIESVGRRIQPGARQ